MGKYLTKEMDEGRKPGEHRYFKTQGIEEGRRELYFVPLSAGLEEETEMAMEVILRLLGGTARGCPNLWIAPAGAYGGGYVCGDLNTA